MNVEIDAELLRKICALAQVGLGEMWQEDHIKEAQADIDEAQALIAEREAAKEWARRQIERTINEYKSRKEN